MTPRAWIEQLEKRFAARSPARVAAFRVAGMPRAEAQRELVQALETAIADPKVTPAQRALGRQAAARIRAATQHGDSDGFNESCC